MSSTFAPIAFGKCLNVEPECVNPSIALYRVNIGKVDKLYDVRDNGFDLHFICDVPTLEELIQWVPNRWEPGGYKTCLAAGHFRLAAYAAGRVTVTVENKVERIEFLSAQAVIADIRRQFKESESIAKRCL